MAVIRDSYVTHMFRLTACALYVYNMRAYPRVTLNCDDINPQSAKLNNLFFTHLKLCLATATHNLKWIKFTWMCTIWINIYAKFENLMHIFLSKNRFEGKTENTKNGYRRDFHLTL